MSCLGVQDLLGLFLAFAFFQFVEPGLEDLHGQIPVAVLGALVLHGNHDPGGNVGEAHGGTGLVDVLAPGAAGPEGVDAQVFFLDVDFDIIVGLGIDKDGGKGGVAAAAGVKGRDADQAVDAAFGFQIAIGIGAVGGKGGAFDAGLVTRQQVIHFGFQTPALGIAQIHAQQYLGPILGLGAAGTGMQGDDGILVVIFPTQHHLQFQAAQVLLLDLELIGGFGQNGLVRLFLGQIQEDFQIFETLFLILPGLQGIG